MKICRVGAELFPANGRTDRQTYMKKLIVTFRSFAYASKVNLFKVKICSCLPYGEVDVLIGRFARGK